MGLFVGVRAFRTGSRIPEALYAVDDAVDLAYLLTSPKDPRRRLLLPSRVYLALSGEPQKEASKAHLAELVAHGARLSGASRSEIERRLAEIGDGPAAVLWVSFATHGRSQGGEEYLLTSDSRPQSLASTALPTQRLLDWVASRRAGLRLVVLDACREQIRSPLPVLELSVDAKTQGPLAVLRARVGGPLFDDSVRKQGVFTGALLDGLGCRAETDDLGRVTVGLLATYVNRRVAAWMKEQLGLEIDEQLGVEARLGGTAADQALVLCHECPRVAQPDHLTADGERLEVYAADGKLLWSHATSGRISQAEIADLDGDGSQEVVIGVSTGGRETGWVFVFDCKGDEVWRADTTAASPYPAGTSGRLAVLRLAMADLYGSGRKQVVTLSHDAQGWLPSRLCVIDDGKLIASYWHPGHLWHLKVAPAMPGGENRIIVAGKNNDLGAAFPGSEYVDVIFLFAPANVRGHAPPYHDSLERGTQLWYGFVLPKELNIEALDITDRDHDGKNEIALSMSQGHFLYLDFTGCPVGSGTGDAAQGEMRYGLFEEDLERCRRPR